MVSDERGPENAAQPEPEAYRDSPEVEAESRAAIERAEAEIAAGNVIPHEEVKRRMREWRTK